MRQLSYNKRIKLDAVREVRRLRLWSASLKFPAAPYEGRGFYHWKIPVPRALVSGPTARSPVQSVCAQVLIDAAWKLAEEKPNGLRHARVAAIIGFPDMFASEICVFFDPSYFASFCNRDSQEQRWTPRPDKSLFDELELIIPDGFSVRGFDTWDRDATFDPPVVETGQTWLIGELGELRV